jgi:hypothetical protein
LWKKRKIEIGGLKTQQENEKGLAQEAAKNIRNFV